MKIKIEPTYRKDYPIHMQNPTVEICIAGDDHSLGEVLEHLITPALKAWGFIIEEGMITLDLDA